MGEAEDKREFGPEEEDIVRSLKDAAGGFDVDIPLEVDDAVRNMAAGEARKIRADKPAGRSWMPIVMTAAACLVIGMAVMFFTKPQLSGTIDYARIPGAVESHTGTGAATGAPVATATAAATGAEGPIMDSRIEKLEKALQAERDRSKRIEEELETASKQISAFETIKISLQKTINMQKELSERLEARAEGLRKKNDLLEKRLADLDGVMDENEELKKSLEKVQVDIRKLASGFINAKKELEKVSAELADTRKENEKLRTAALVMGDYGGDGLADVADAMQIVNDSLSGKARYVREADLNGDGKVDVGDAMLIVNKSLER